MTQPNDLPPLPEGMRGYDHENGEWHMICFESQLRAYGEQCVESERKKHAKDIERLHEEIAWLGRALERAKFGG